MSEVEGAGQLPAGPPGDDARVVAAPPVHSSNAVVAATPAEAPPAPGANAEGDPRADADASPARRRRGSRGGRGRARGGPSGEGEAEGGDPDQGDDVEAPRARRALRPGREPGGDRNPDLPDRHLEGRPQSAEAAERALVRRKPRIGDTLPAPPASPPARRDEPGDAGGRSRRRRGGRGARPSPPSPPGRPVEALLGEGPVELGEEVLASRRGRERKGRPVGRYLMAVHVHPKAVQIAVLEGKQLIEHYVARPQDDVSQIHGNIYLGRVQNVLPGMEAAFVDIGTPKNAVLYRGDVHWDKEDIEESGPPRIEQMLRAKQSIICQVTKNPIAHKGARLTQEVSLPGRFVVLIPNSRTYGISKRLPDQERRRLRAVLDTVKPPEHGLIVRTAAENVTAEEIQRDVRRLLSQWDAIEKLAKRSKAPALLYTEPNMALRVIREEFNSEYRSVIIDDERLFEDVRDYVRSISPELEDRVEHWDPAVERLPIFEAHHVAEQLRKALDRKVWLPSGGSLVIEHTEALTVIDVNTGKNVGNSSLEETVFRNNLEAAVEIARQLRLRDVGGIIVIDFVDMEVRANREETVRVFREALARDKTRTQVFDISELGLVEMTRKRIGEGLLESLSEPCPHCGGLGLVHDKELLQELE